MTFYKHTQIGYLILAVTLIVTAIFVWAFLMARAEVPSVDSGTNLLVTLVMALTLFLLLSFATLAVTIDEKFLKIKFGYGIFAKKFALDEIAKVDVVRNHWYYGWGIRFWFWPPMWIYNISGFDAVQITLKNGKVYRIGTDDAEGLRNAIKQNFNKFML